MALGRFMETESLVRKQFFAHGKNSRKKGKPDLDQLASNW